MGNTQYLILTGILALIRLKSDKIPLEFLKDSPNKRTALAFVLMVAFYNLLRHNGLLRKKNISGQHVFITGGAMGIGKQMAIRFAKQNCKVTIADLNEEFGNKTVEQLLNTFKNNPNIMFVKCDVSNVESVKAAAEACESKFGVVDILINNAGIVTGKKLLDNTEKGIEKTYAVNAISHAYTVRQFLPNMIKQDKGHIVTIASIAGHMGVAGLADYCGSKFAAVGFDESIRMELKNMKSRVQTTCICPYYINTGMFDGINPGFILNMLLPMLDENYVANRIINAIRQNEKLVLIPWFLYVLKFLQAVLPIEVTDSLMDLFGVNNSMDKFKGRCQPKK